SPPRLLHCTIRSVTSIRRIDKGRAWSVGLPVDVVAATRRPRRPTLRFRQLPIALAREERLDGRAYRRLSQIQGGGLAGRALALRGAGALGPEPRDHDPRLLRFARRSADDFRRGARRVVRAAQRRGDRPALSAGLARLSRRERGARIRRACAESLSACGDGPRAMRRGARAGLW